MSAKTGALKDALGFFIAMIVVHLGWNLIARTNVGLGQMLFVSAGAALFMYFLKRKDLFD